MSAEGVLAVIGLQLLPLLGSEHAPDIEHHVGVALFQFAARGRDFINLRRGLGFVGIIGLDQRLEQGFLLFQGACRSMSFMRLS